jgi:hypothetical protein
MYPMMCYDLGPSDKVPGAGPQRSQWSQRSQQYRSAAAALAAAALPIVARTHRGRRPARAAKAAEGPGEGILTSPRPRWKCRLEHVASI